MWPYLEIRVFTEVIKLKWGDRYPYKKGNFGKRHAHKDNTMWRDTGRRQPCISQGERSATDLTLTALRKNQQCSPFNFRLLTSKSGGQCISAVSATQFVVIYYVRLSKLTPPTWFCLLDDSVWTGIGTCPMLEHMLSHFSNDSVRNWVNDLNQRPVKKYMYVCVTGSPCCTVEIDRTLKTSYDGKNTNHLKKFF